MRNFCCWITRAVVVTDFLVNPAVAIFFRKDPYRKGYAVKKEEGMGEERRETRKEEWGGYERRWRVVKGKGGRLSRNSRIEVK